MYGGWLLWIIGHLFCLCLLFTWDQCTVTVCFPPSLPPGVLGVFCAGRKWTTLFRLQSSAAHRLLPWLHYALSPNLWNGCKCQCCIRPTAVCFGRLVDIRTPVFDVSNAFPCLSLYIYWPVNSVDEGSCKRPTTQLDYWWNSRDRRGHLCYHGKTKDGPASTKNLFWCQLSHICSFLQ